MNNKNLRLITLLSLLPCIAHGVMLHTPFNNYAYSSAIKLILFMLFPYVYFRMAQEGKFADLFRIKEHTKSIKQSCVLGIMVFAFIFIGFAVIHPWLDSNMITDAMSNVGITGNNYIFAFLYYVMVNVALEELFFRGFVFHTLYRMNQKKYAHGYSSLLFAVYHIAVIKDGIATVLIVISVIGLVGVGLLFNEITRRCENVVGSIVVHASASLAISLIGLFYLYK